MIRRNSFFKTKTRAEHKSRSRGFGSTRKSKLKLIRGGNMITVELVIDLGDLGTCPGYARGSVTPQGDDRFDVRVHEVRVVLPKLSLAAVDVTHMCTKAFMATVEEELEARSLDGIVRMHELSDEVKREEGA